MTRSPAQLALALALTTAACAGKTTPPRMVPDDDEIYGVAEMTRDAKLLEAQAETPWVKQWLAEAKNLPTIAPRTLYLSEDR